MSNNNTFVIDDGAEEYVFKNKFGEEFARFSFNPADTNIIERYNKVVKFISETTYFEDEEKTNEEELIRMNHELEEQFNVLCGKNVSDGLFKIYAPLTLFADGTFYAEVCINKIAEFVEKALDVRLSNKKAKIRKEIAKNRA